MSDEVKRALDARAKVEYEAASRHVPDTVDEIMSMEPDIDEAAEGGFFFRGERLPDWSWKHRAFFNRFRTGCGAMEATAMVLYILSLKRADLEAFRFNRDGFMDGVERFAVANGIDEWMGDDGMVYSPGYVAAMAVVNRILAAVDVSESTPELNGSSGADGPKP